MRRCSCRDAAGDRPPINHDNLLAFHCQFVCGRHSGYPRADHDRIARSIVFEFARIWGNVDVHP